AAAPAAPASAGTPAAPSRGVSAARAAIAAARVPRPAEEPARRGEPSTADPMDDLPSADDPDIVSTGLVGTALVAGGVYEGAVQDSIDELGRLPGVGPKSAQRIAFHSLAADAVDVRRLADALTEVKARVRFCETCGNVAESEQCRICADPRRSPEVICVVEEPKDVVAIERTREFRGRYHVLGGAINPIENVGPGDSRIAELMSRLADGQVTEVILATDPNVEGEATATYLARMLGPMGSRVTRLASGLPVGGDLEYADEVTLGRAFEGRRLVGG
ncbi:hypothetical protein OY671_003461, partial [Metschnikowia pulcherrima]